MIEQTSVLFALGGVAALITAVVGAAVALSKRRPQVSQVIVEAAGNLIAVNAQVLENLRRQIADMEARSAAQEAALRAEMAQMREDMTALAQSRDQAFAELAVAKGEVDRLRARVALLEDTIRDQGGTPPPGPNR